MIQEFLGDQDDWGVADRRVKPALLTLLHDQAALLDASYGTATHDLRSGFPTGRALINWYQKATVRTLGNIADGWPPIDCVDDETIRAACVRDAEGKNNLADWKATGVRRLLEAIIVQPACNRGYKALRPAATEYIASDDGETEASGSLQDLDPGRQKHVAMRPGFQTLDRQQQRVLEELWDGFDSTDALLDWLHGLNSPTNGEIADDIAQQVITDDVARAHLVEHNDTEAARGYREIFACGILLPAFVAGVRSLETAELASAEQQAPTTLRMKGGQQ